MLSNLSKELELRKSHLCAVPFTGMTINPRGHVTLCCMAPDHVVGQLSEIPDLTDFYNSTAMDYYRTEMEGGRISSLIPCDVCWKRHSEGHHTWVAFANSSPHLAKNFDADWQLRKD